MSFQSYAPAVQNIRKDTIVYRTKDSLDMIKNGKYFAFARERSAEYGKVVGTFRVEKDLRLVDLTAQNTIDWMEEYHRDQFQVLSRYLDLQNHSPVPYGDAVDSAFADNDNVAPAMEEALWVVMNKEKGQQYKCDGWYIPPNKLWPPSSKNAGESFHSEVMLFDWRQCLSFQEYEEKYEKKSER